MNFSQLTFGSFSLKIYGLLIAIAFAISAWSFYKKVEKANLDIDFFVHHFWRWCLGGLILGRIFAVAFNPEIWSQYGVFTLFAFWEGTLNFLGALIGFVITLLLDFHRAGKSPFRWLDKGVLPFYIGLMISDLAGFLTGAVYGHETNLPWGIRYETFGVESINPVHPVTLYAFAIHLLFYLWLRSKETRWISFPGRFMAWGGFLLIIADFFLQFFRSGENFIGMMNLTQILDIVALTILWWYVKRFHKTS